MLTTGQNATRYATGYSETTFAQIRAGMTREDVFRLLGQPLERVTYPDSWPEMHWVYSQATSRSGHFHLRTVRFAPDGTVSTVFKEFHFD